MNLRQAAEMALEALMQTEDVMVEVEPNVWEYKSIVAIQALRQALAEEALDRMAAENQRLGLYDDGPAVKTYCTPEVTPEVTPDVNNPYTKLDTTAGVLHKEWVGLTKEDFYKKDDETVFVLGMKFAEARLKEKNT